MKTFFRIVTLQSRHEHKYSTANVINDTIITVCFFKSENWNSSECEMDFIEWTISLFLMTTISVANFI